MADVRVRDIMSSRVIAIAPDDSLHEAARTLAMNEISGAPVVEEGRLVGMVSEWDIMRGAFAPVPVKHGHSPLDMFGLVVTGRPRLEHHGVQTREVMSPYVASVAPDDSIWKAARTIETHGVKRVPVLDGEKLVGIVSRSDIVRAIGKDDGTISHEVREAIYVLGEENFEDLTIQVADGVATISGTADRGSTHELALKIASRVPGVVEVVDRMNHRFDAKANFQPPPEVDPRRNWNVLEDASR
jgi:CBS domain-containing protein